MSSHDKKLIDACIGEEVEALFRTEPLKNGIPGSDAPAHPMDGGVVKELKSLSEKLQDDDDYEIFRYRERVDKLWGTLLEKAVICLRFYDTREPFQANGETKKPKAYGIEDLREYYKKYTEFERVLYGSGRYYRDHVIHVFRTWLSGVAQMVKNNGDCLDQITIREKKIELELTRAEKLSMWTIIALTHDLGYPLEKAKSIIDVTQDMLTRFITNPDISVDFSFHGAQNYMNDFVLRLMSSKMRQCRVFKMRGCAKEPEPRYVARLQSKYYFKFQKSLERNKHGILSALIIYKLLTYFLESDYSLNEDYKFDKEDCRQFYIRREILRAIASHTCDDIYQMYMGSFSFLLRICDDTQEWGRKNISELYMKSEQTYELEDIALVFGGEPKGKTNNCTIRETITMPDSESVRALICRFYKQALTYVTIFRDGQDTSLRDFSFVRKLTIKCLSVMIDTELKINNDQASELTGTITYNSNRDNNKHFGKEFFKDTCKEIYKNNSKDLPKDVLTILGSDGNEINSPKVTEAEKWATGKFCLPLST